MERRSSEVRILYQTTSAVKLTMQHQNPLFTEFSLDEAAQTKKHPIVIIDISVAFMHGRRSE